MKWSNFLMSIRNGFTLIELLVVIAIASILTMIAIPSFQTMLQNSRLTSATNSLLSALQYARSEAITQRVAITVSPLSGVNWASGAIIMKGVTKLRETPPAGAGVTVTGSAASITYQPNGSTTATTFSIEDSRPSIRQIKVNGIGQACAGSSCS
jgi:type IV fimbrial biogenesis protein FimT